MLWVFFNLVFFLFGLAAGSFLNCVIYRLETGDSFLKGRSFCPHCRHILSWQDLIPVLSFIFLKGKCRYCSEKISWQYPLVELATGILFISIFNFQFSIFNLIIACFLIVIFVYDLKHYLILDKVIYPAIGVAFFYQLFRGLELGAWKLEIGNLEPLILSILSAIGAAAFFLFIVLVSRGRWMGVGDIKLAFLMGILLGWPNILVALFLAFLIGAIIGIGLIVAGRKKLKSEIPFGPFLVTGTFLTMFFGERLLYWYLTLFLVK